MDDQQEKAQPALCNRPRVDGPYTVLPNTLVQSKGIKLTPNEFRVLAYIASVPEDWSLKIGQVADVCAMGRDAVYDAIHGLQDHGLARHLIAREGGRIRARRWEFTLTPGLFKEPDDSLFLETRIKRKKLVPENPDQDSPDQVKSTLQSLISHKHHSGKRSKPDQRDFIQEVVVVTDGAAGEGAASRPAPCPAEGTTGSPVESLPSCWPFPDTADVTKRVRNSGVAPQAVWTGSWSAS
jgi:hypothetical protein